MPIKIPPLRQNLVINCNYKLMSQNQCRLPVDINDNMSTIENTKSNQIDTTLVILAPAKTKTSCPACLMLIDIEINAVALDS